MSLNVEILEASFECVKPHFTEFASSFYKNLLLDYPQLRPLFAKTNMEQQQQKLMMSLALIIENLRKPNYLNTILINLGGRHVSYGTIQEHYPMVGAALLKTFESYLGTDWTPEVKQAWTDAYEVLINIMLEGAKYHQETVKDKDISSPSVKPIVSGQAPQQVFTTTSSMNNSQETVKDKDISSPSVKPIVSGQAPQQVFTTTSSMNNSQETVKDKDISSPSVKPVAIPKAQEQATVKSFRLNLKLLLLIFVVVGSLYASFLYYHSNSKQNKSSIRTFYNFEFRISNSFY